MPVAEKFDTPQVLDYTYITVKFQFRRSINVRLTESYLNTIRYDSVYLTCSKKLSPPHGGCCIERFPKMGVWGDLVAGAKIFGGKYIRPQNCAFSHIFGPDLTRRVVALRLCSGIANKQNFDKIWGSPVPLPEVAEKQRCRKAPHGPSTTTWKNRNHSAI